MLIAALLVVAKKEKQLTCSLADEQKNKSWYIGKMV